MQVLQGAANEELDSIAQLDQQKSVLLRESSLAGAPLVTIHAVAHKYKSVEDSTHDSQKPATANDCVCPTTKQVAGEVKDAKAAVKGKEVAEAEAVQDVEAAKAEKSAEVRMQAESKKASAALQHANAEKEQVKESMEKAEASGDEEQKLKAKMEATQVQVRASKAKAKVTQTMRSSMCNCGSVKSHSLNY